MRNHVLGQARTASRRALEVTHLLPIIDAWRRPDTTSDRATRDEAAMKVALAATLRSDSNCIDVGAHEGSVLDVMVRIAPLGQHIAFEPLPPFAAQLRRRFPEVDVRELALSDHAGQASFTFVKTNPAYSGLRERTYPGNETTEVLTVDTARLDDCLPPDYVLAVLKIDVEGAEGEVLRGATRTIRTHRPVVLFEHGQGGADHYAVTSAEIHDLLSAAGLRIFDSDGLGPYSADEFVASFTAPMWNWIAVPSDRTA